MLFSVKQASLLNAGCVGQMVIPSAPIPSTTRPSPSQTVSKRSRETTSLVWSPQCVEKSVKKVTKS